MSASIASERLAVLLLDPQGELRRGAGSPALDRLPIESLDGLVGRTGSAVPDALVLPAGLLDHPALVRHLARRPDVALLAVDGAPTAPGVVPGPGGAPRARAGGAGLRAHERLGLDDLAPARLPLLIVAAVARVRAERTARAGARETHRRARRAGRENERRRADRRLASDAELALFDALGRAVRPSLSPAEARAAVVRAVREHTGADEVRMESADGIDARASRPIDAAAAAAAAAAATRPSVSVTLPLSDAERTLVVDGIDEALASGADGLLERVAAQAAVLLERARLHAERRTETRRSDALLEIDRVLGTDAPLDQRIRSVLSVLAEAFDATWALLYEGDARRRVPVRAVQFARGDTTLELYGFEALERTRAWGCALDGEPTLSGSADRVPAEDPAVERRHRAAGAGAMLIVPMRPRGDRRGCLVLVRHETAEDFEPSDLGASREAADSLSMLIERAELLERVAGLAGRDALTGLANRRRFETELTERCAHAERQPFALLFVDLDGFKRVNDSLGHEIGDRLLETVAARLQGLLEPADLLARLGGDEFAALVADGADGARRSDEIARCVLECVRAPIAVADQRLHVGASVGVARCPGHSRSASSLLRAADAAMYLAKREGRGRVREWSPELESRAARRLAVESSLRACLESDCGELSLVFQAQLSVPDRRVTGVEVFARWQDAELGPVSPAEFIEVAAQSRLLVPLSHWVLERTCRAIATLGESMAPERVPTLSMNVPAEVLADADFVPSVEAAVRRHGIAPSALGVELGESGLMHDVDALVERLHALRRLGVRVALDDFGTGRSALRHLVRLPLHSLKIDRTFVARLGEHHENDVLVRTMLRMATDLGLDTVAEGVETERQLARLGELGCDAAQGWLLARPESLDALSARLTGSRDEARRAA